MGYNGAPVTVTGAVITALNPSKNLSSQPAVAAQVANSSPWLLNVQTQNGVLSIQPYTAQSIPVAVGQDVVITPTLQVYSVTGGYVQLYWMIQDERPPQPDGPLTAAATIAGALITTTSQLRQLTSQVLTANSAHNTMHVTGLQPTDRFLIIGTSITNAAPALWIDNVTGDQSGLVLPVNDVASYLHLANVPLTGLDTGVTVDWWWAPSGTSGALPPTFFVFASSAPVPQTPATGFATASLTASGNVALSFFGPGSAGLNLPSAIRLHSANFFINGQAFADLFVGGTGGKSIYGEVSPAGAAGAAANTSRSFSPGVIICNGAIGVGVADSSPSAMRLVASGLAAGNSTAISLNFDWLA